MRPLVLAALSLSLLLSCQYPWSPAERACADHAQLALPIDLQVFASKGTLRPFGIHGGANPEGHPGLDFILNSSDAAGDPEVLASFSATVLSVTPETDYPGSSCLVMDSACVEVNLCHVHLEAGIKAGSHIIRGQKLGTIGRKISGDQFNLHFGTYSGPEADLTCPEAFLDTAITRCVLGLSVGDSLPKNCGTPQNMSTMLGRSVFPETSARDMLVQCADSSTQLFHLPAETRFCASRLSAEDRSRMNACLGSACAGIW